MVSARSTLDGVRPKTLDDVKGWFTNVDQEVFRCLLDWQADAGQRGDLLELGCYLGKSAILLGQHLQPGEHLTVCDLFDAPAADDATAREQHVSYPSLTRDAFEANYLAFHDHLPTIVQGLTSEIADHVAPGTCRFIHVDASHLYRNVRGDIQAARRLGTPDAVVVCDDFRSEHTPGVAAAVWEAVFTTDLRPICLTRAKLYATWGDPQPIQAGLRAWLERQDWLWYEVQEIAGRPVIRIRQRGATTDPESDSEVPTLKRELQTTDRQLHATRRELEGIRSSRTFRLLRTVARWLGRRG